MDELLEFVKDTSMLPVYLTGPGTKIVEVIVCLEISGGADYINNMPKELTLIRKCLDGRQYEAKYIQEE